MKKPQIPLIVILLLAFTNPGCTVTQPTDQAKKTPTIQTAIVTTEPTPTSTRTPIPISTLESTPAPTLPAGVDNVVQVDFFNRYGYYSDRIRFTNREVKSSFHSAIILNNTPDESTAPVYGLGLEFSSDPGITSFSNVQSEYLEEMGPPVFKWFFGDLSEPEDPASAIWGAESYIASEAVSVGRFTPGFDASVEVDKKIFSEPGEQVVTLTIIPRQKIDSLNIIFHLDGGKYRNDADAVITSLDPGKHTGSIGESIIVSQDRKDIEVAGENFSPTVDEPYTFTMTLQVNPRGTEAPYKPYTAIAWLEEITEQESASYRGTTIGDVLRVPVDGVGTWIWTANGDYLWEWQGPGLQYEVSFN